MPGRKSPTRFAIERRPVRAKLVLPTFSVEGRRLLDRYFKLTENQTTVKQEFLGGLTTFLTMAYIVVVNPQILAQAGMPVEGVF